MGEAERLNGTGKPVVLITGASAGIGEAVAHRFARAGYAVMAVARGAERLEQMAGKLRSQTEVLTFAGDVAAPGTADQAVERTMQRFGRLDCLVNNAGSGRWAPVHETDDAMMDEVIDTSLKGPFRFCRAALQVMKRGSSIVTVGSVFGMVGGLDGGIYCAVKAGLGGLTQTLAAQYGSSGIRSNLVAPGVIRTDMTEAAWELDSFRRINHEMTPSDRDGTVEDVANIVYFLASPEGSYLNGQSIAADGGWSTTKFLSREALLAQRVPVSAAGLA